MLNDCFLYLIDGFILLFVIYNENLFPSVFSKKGGGEGLYALINRTGSQ
jgi:hypothetical protein